MLKTFHDGQLVTVADEGGDLDGVVAHVPSLIKVEVAVEEAERGPVFRTVHPKALTPRDAPGPADDALRKLIHRAGGTGHAEPGGGSPGHGRPAHTRAAMHRTTGR